MNKKSSPPSVEPIRREARIQTLSGRMPNVCDLKASNIELKDIAMPLSRLARFNGHTEEFYSVAQHSVIASLMVEERKVAITHEDYLRLARLALLHDAHEAYIGDIASPLKPLAKQLVALSESIDRAIFEWAGLPRVLRMDDEAVVKDIDRRVLATEKRDVLAHTLTWPNFNHPPFAGWSIQSMLLPQDAFKLFCARWNELFGIDAQLLNPESRRSQLFGAAGLVKTGGAS